MTAKKKTPCTIEGCDRLESARGWCEAHYYRWRRTGSTGAPEVWDRVRPTCKVDDCCEPHVAHGYCLNHMRRVAKGGHPDYVGPSIRFGENNHAWSGDTPSYNAAHLRVRQARGPARNHTCADCAGAARHWSYGHADPDELVTPEGLPYSADPSMYDPRCVPCHKRFDLAHLAAVAS